MQFIQRRDAVPQPLARTPSLVPEGRASLRQQLRASTYAEGAALLAPPSKDPRQSKDPEEAKTTEGADLASVQATLSDLAMGCDALRALLQNEMAEALARGDLAAVTSLGEAASAVGEFGTALSTLTAVPDVLDAYDQLQAMQAQFAAARSSGNASDQLAGYIAAFRFVDSASGPLGLVPGLGEVAALVGALAQVVTGALTVAQPYFNYVDGVFDCTSQDVIGDPVDAQGNPVTRRSCGD